MIPLSPDEKIHHIVRKHWFILFRDIIGSIFLFAIPFVAYMLFPREGVALTPETTLSLPTISSNLIFLLSSAWTLLWWTRLVAIWTDYYLDTWVVTNKRIIDIEQKGFFSRQVSSFRVDRIQDVTVDTHGIIATLLHFGNIHVQTAGAGQKFVIHGIPNPDELKDKIATLAMHG
jgi:uncharacterized membrane protein YdbT with pleckstrin-like domain